MATRTISTKLAVDGESQYKQAITNCNSELGKLKSALAATESEFRSNANSLEALRKKDEALNALKAQQVEKVKTLEEALKNCKKAVEEYTGKQSDLKGKLEASNEAVAGLDSAAKKAGEQWAKYAKELEDSKNALEALKKKSTDTSAEQAKLEEAIAKTEAEMKELEDSTGGAARKAGELLQENKKLNADFETNTAKLDAATRGANSWEKQLNQAKIEVNKLDDQLEENNRYLNEAESDFYKCAKSIDEYGNEVKDAGEDSQRFGDTSKEAINQLAAALAAAGVAKAVEEIAAALKECVDTFASFQSQMSIVQAISGASAFQMQELAEKAKYMGATTSFTATEAGQALEYMAMAGWKTDDMLGGLEGIMHLAAASGESLASTSDIVTDALTAFGLAASDSARFADVLAAASSNSNTNVGMMGETFKYAAPVAGALGYSIEDTALAIGLMANAGIKGSQAGTALRGTLTNLTKPSEENAKYMEKLGISLTDASGNVRSLSELMDILRERFSDLTEAEQAEYAAGIAGKEAMSGLLAIVNASEADYQKLTAAINTCNGSAKKMSETRLDNYAGQITLLESALDGLKLELGSQLAPVLTEIAGGFTTVLGGLTKLLEICPGFTALIAGLVTSFGALTAAFAGFTIIKTIMPMIKAFNVALAANPLGAVAIAAVGVVTVLGTLAASMGETDEKTKSFTASLEESKTAYEDLTATMAEQQTSTKAVADSLLGLLAVEEKSALQKDLIAQKVDQLNEAVPGLGLYYDREKDALVGLTEAELESMLARAAAQEEYEAQVARLNELTSEQAEIEARLTEARLALNEAQQTGSGNTWELQNDIEALTAAQEENAAQIAALEEASRAYGEQQAENTLKTETMTATVEGLISEIEALQASYEESYQAAMESIDAQLGLFNELDGTAKTSIDNLIDSLKNQASYMETYAANIQKAMEMGVDMGLVKKLSDGSEESAQILAAIVQGGEEDIAALNEQLAKVEEGKENFSTTVADMETDFSNKMTELVRDLDKAIQDMDVQNDAYRIGQNNIQGLINGTASKRQELINKYAEMGRAALAAYKREVGQASPSKKFHEVGRYDIQGIIGGAEAEKPRLAAAYEQAAQTALASMERHLPSTIVEPSAAAAQDRQTKAIVAAVSARGGGEATNPIYIDKLVVRDESDVHCIAQELYYMTQRERRSRGGGGL